MLETIRHWFLAASPKTLPAAVEELPDKSVVVLGDLNASMWSPHYRQLVKRSGLRNARRGYGVHPTCGSVDEKILLRAVPFDHCLVDDSWVVKDFRSGPYLGSDHLPIVIELGFAE